ncbi:type III pantothenate kinase [candidate division WOR-3 bacterium]|nr:type III pantothenate kinase [candidate division WOR-3 bacterium]
MILTVIVGNTNARFAWFNRRRLAKNLVLPTPAVHRGRLPKPGSVVGTAVASVVPDVTGRLARNLLKATGLEPLVVGPQTQTGLRFNYRRKDLGADRVCIAVGANCSLPSRDVVVFDFGTATTVNVVLRDRVFAGGAILPGIQMCLDALAANTARLPRLLPRNDLSPIQRGTRAALQAGVAALFAGGIDRIIDRVERGLRRPVVPISTGGAAVVARRYTRRIGSIRPHLASEGLAEIWYMNRDA